ncbi:MAG: hypothetical protein SOZ48_05415 [Eubacterium sp.]|nr:hypothetical protein [Eubacterium sp.]
MPGKKAIFVILDCDDEDCAKMKRRLMQMYQELRNASSYYEIGMFKCDCARRIGVLLDIRKNASPSFNYFIGKLDAFYGSSTENDGYTLAT